MIYLFDQMATFSASDFNICLKLMSYERYNKIQKYKFNDDKIRSALVYLLLRIGLLAEFCYINKPRLILNEDSKPELADISDVKFNLSHCKKAVACAISKYEVGIDVQEFVVYEEGLGKTVLSGAEREFVENSSDRDAAFTRIWAQKESYGKYLGCGIGYELKSTNFTDINPVGDNDCTTITEEFPDYVMAVSSQEHLPIKVITYNDLLYYMGCFHR